MIIKRLLGIQRNTVGAPREDWTSTATALRTCATKMINLSSRDLLLLSRLLDWDWLHS